jgi:hypothetical protein
MGDPLDTHVQAQLQAAQLTTEDLKDAILNMPRNVSPGLGGMCYEHVQVILFDESRTDVPELARSAITNVLAFVNCQLAINLPAYFYILYDAVRLAALNKIDPRDLRILQINKTIILSASVMFGAESQQKASF